MESLASLRQQLALTDDPETQFEIASNIAFCLARSWDMQACQYAARALELRQRHRLDREACRAWYAEAMCLDHRNRKEEAMRLWHRAEGSAQRAGDRECRVAALIAMAGEGLHRSDYRMALERAQEAENICRAHGEELLSASLIIGRVYHLQRDFLRALDIFLPLVEKAAAQGDLVREANCCKNIADVYRAIRDHERCRQYLQRALKLYRQAGVTVGICAVYKALAALANTEEQHDEALRHLRAAQHLEEQHGTRRLRPVTLNGFGSAYLGLGRLPEALASLEESRALASEAGIVNLQAHCDCDMAIVLRRLDRLDEAADRLGRAKELAENIDDRLLLYEIHCQWALLCRETGKTDDEVEHLRRSGALFEELHGPAIQQGIAHLSQQYERQRGAAERELLQLRANDLEQRIEEQNAALSKLVLSLAERRQGLERLRQEVERARENARGRHLAFASDILRDVKAQLQQEEEWERFERQFDSVHIQFQERLRQRCPALTPAEIKVCTLLRLNISSKDVAAMLCIALNTVNTHRQRIRRKLEIPPAANLVPILLEL